MREVILMQSNKKEPKSLSIGIWKQMFPFFRPYRKEFATTFSLNILLILVDVAVPLFQSYAIDHFIVPDTLHGIQLFVIAYAGVIIMQMVCVFFSVRAAITIEMNVGRDMKRAQFVHLQKLSFSYYNTTPVGYIHARVMSDTSDRIGDCLGAGRYVLGVRVCAWCICHHVCIELEAGSDHYAGSSVYCRIDFCFSEKDVVLEPGYPGGQFRNNRSV